MKKSMIAVAIAGVLSAACLVGCGAGGEKIKFGMYDQTSEETSVNVASEVSSNGIKINGNLGNASTLEVKIIENSESIYHKVKTQINEENLVLMELYYINILDENGEKLKQNGEAEFTFPLSSEIKKAGGDTFDLYYYNSSEDKLNKIDFDRYGDILRFNSAEIGFFVVLKTNNTGEPITNPPKETKPAETRPEETKAPETKPVETKPVETKAPETMPATTGEIFTMGPTFEEITTYHSEPTKATEAQTEAKPQDTPTIAGSGNNEEPKLEFRLSAKDDGNCFITYVNVTNLGNYTLRILPENASFTDKDFPENNRQLKLTDYDYNPLSYQDIEPGKSAKVYFSIIGGASWYHKNSTYVNFDVSYDGNTYECKTIYNGKVSVAKK